MSTRFAATGMALAQQGCKNIAVIVTAAAGTEKINAAQHRGRNSRWGCQRGGNLHHPRDRRGLGSRRWPLRGRPARTASPPGVSPAQSGPLITAVNAGSPKLKITAAAGGVPPALLTAAR